MRAGRWMILIITITLLVSSPGCATLGFIWKSDAKPAASQPGVLTLRDTAGGSLSQYTDRWYRYDVWDVKGEQLTVTIDWIYSDGNTIHQVGFGVYDESQFNDYMRNNGAEGIGVAAVTGAEADNGPPISRKVWEGKLPEGSYFIRVYSDAEPDMDYSITVAKER